MAWLETDPVSHVEWPDLLGREEGALDAVSRVVVAAGVLLKACRGTAEAHLLPEMVHFSYRFVLMVTKIVGASFSEAVKHSRRFRYFLSQAAQYQNQ